jgi:F-type H+-transporting ATPase subunit epsilon
MSAAPTAPAASHGHGAPATRGRGLRVAIVTPEGLAFEGAASSVVVPGHDGEVAFLPHHAGYVGALGYGELRVTTPEGVRRRWFLEGGVAEVAGDAVTVLAERVLAVEKIDVAKARADLDRALALVPVNDLERGARDRAQASARARLRVAGTPGTSTPAH